MLEFRNYRALSWSPAPHLNVIFGPNAQGKSNLLEALGFLVTGRSFRTSRSAELPRWGTEAATLSGDLIRAETRRTIRRGLSKLEDGTWQTTGEASPEWARAIAFGWQDLEIVNGGPVARRNFIDGFAARLYVNHVPTLIRYRRILARRNRLLQQRPVPCDVRQEIDQRAPARHLPSRSLPRHQRQELQRHHRPPGHGGLRMLPLQEVRRAGASVDCRTG